MIITLEPPTGVPPLLLGMTLDEATAAISVWGTPQPRRGSGSPRLRVKDEALTRDVFAYFEDGVSLTAIEVWCPMSPDSTVIWDGIDMFRTDADEILAELVGRGIRLNLADALHPFCPDVALGLTREQASGRFESVLVARPGYYARFDTP